jgi:uncharacterized membrane protein
VSPIPTATSSASAPSRNSAMAGASRLRSLDALRGAVMIVMALDHVRDFFHAGAMSFSPTDLTRTTAALFFTRWVTHFCAPVFFFAAGAGAFLWWQRGRSRGELSRFLLTRGVWLIVLEVTVMRFAYQFSMAPRYPVLLVVLWALGASMIALAALVWLPVRVLAVLSVATVALHDLFPGGRFLHQPGVLHMGQWTVFVAYPLVPWIAVMAAGFCFGPILHRSRIVATLGVVLTAAFVALRLANVYGDPAPWTSGLLSFLNTTKYPPSLAFLLMTLGPALLALAWLDRRTLSDRNPLVVFGRVPLFYFVLHFYAAHVLAVVCSWIRYGAAAAGFLFEPFPSTGGPRELFPPDFGFSLDATYIAWVAIVVAMYPLCRWFAKVKATRRDWWLGYL